ncbi:ABC transporter ATP-binding protein [Rubeoparvulum massiliense]|uniref:ABC transporter ATP-binding protein n=1 Tax=Rubeoparvulum massiliense TaxID=1631346 RepID=UPI00065E006B|nr:ABC transporter ATP-binding protein [Rubeoparvulum massiliense]
MYILEAEGLTKIYGSKKGTVTYKALDQFDLAVEEGEFVGVMGPSGSGKTTLLNLLATIDRPTSGSLKINGTNPTLLNNRKLALFRRQELGFIFQDFNLMDTLTIKENILLPLALDRVKVSEMEQRVEEIAKLLNITEILDKRTYEVSGGQQQRAACARAMIHQPALLLADEPTGNLDSKAAKDVMDALTSLNEQKGATILMVTHDPAVASYCDRIIFIKDGKFFSEIRKGSQRQAFFQQILDCVSMLGGNFNELEASRS